MGLLQNEDLDSTPMPLRLFWVATPLTNSHNPAELPNLRTVKVRAPTRKQGKQYIIYKWSHAKNWKPKGLKESKLLRKQCISKQSTKSYEYKIAKSSSPSVSWKLNTSLTQKDTMDRRAWIKKFRKKGMRRTQRTKVQKHKKVQNGMGMRNKWIFLFTRFYDPVVSKLEATQRQR